jgi:hypothetical protein
MTENNRIRTTEEIDAEIERLKNLKKNNTLKGALNDMPGLNEYVSSYRDKVNAAKRNNTNNANSTENRIRNYEYKIQELEAQRGADDYLIQAHDEIMGQIEAIIKDGVEAGNDEQTILSDVEDVISAHMISHRDLVNQMIAIKNEREIWMADLKAPRRKKKENQEDNHPLEMEAD